MLWRRFTNAIVEKVLRFNKGAELTTLRTDGTTLARKAAKFLAANQVFTQVAPAAKTTSATLTAAEILGGLLTGNQGGGAGATYTLPTGTAIEDALLAISPPANNDAFEFAIINLSTVAAEIITVATNTGLTMVGDLTVAPLIAGDTSNGVFRVRRTAANTYSVYRVG